MKQLFLFLLGIYSLNSFGQENPIPCLKSSDHSIPGIYSKVLPLENPDDFEKDSVIFQFPDTLKEGRNYIYVINRKKHDLFFRLSTFGANIPNVIQEALDSNGNWIAIEHVPDNFTYYYPPVKFMYPNQYIAFTKYFYKEGNYCTKIRFKFIGRYKNYYSQTYNGCIDSCLLILYNKKLSINSQSKLLEIYRSKDISNEEKIKWIEDNWDPNKEKNFTQTILILYKKIKDYENAFHYAERLVKIDTNSGKGYLHKGDLYIAGAKECYPEDIWIQKLSIHLALEEWNKAKRFTDSKKEAEKRINQYIHRAFESEGCIGPGGGFNPNKTFHIGCWINRTVKYK